jgi:hypothetical protein
MSGGVFNIGSQQAGVVNNVAGDQTIGQLQAGLEVGALAAVGDLRSALAAAGLPEPERRAAGRAVDEVEGELRRPAPDRRRVAGRLEELAGLLGRAGALAAAADRLVPPLQHLAGWLGPAGHALLALLP